MNAVLKTLYFLGVLAEVVIRIPHEQFTPLYVLRMPREERMMLHRFGEEYRVYMDRTGRVVPRLP